MKRSTLITAAIYATSSAIIAVPFLALADDTFVPLTNLPGLTSTSASAISLPTFINNLYRIAIGVAAFFAVVEIAWAGYLFMTSADSISKNTKARQKIANAIIGLVLVLSPYVVFSVINPSILNISLNFSKLQSKNGTGGDVTPAGATDSTAAGDRGGDATCTDYTNPTITPIGSCGAAVPVAAKCCAGMDSSGNYVCCATHK